MKIIVSASPHIHDDVSTQSIMRDVLIALCPTLIASCIIFGLRALLVTLVCVAACVFFEWGFEKLCNRPNTISDLSAAVTGVILAFNLPLNIPLWQAVFGSLVAIVAVKQLFGGIGKNFANPAIVGRIAMFLAFSSTMTQWTFPDGVSSATPLALMAAGRLSELPPLTDLLLGMRGGCIGETCIITLVIGGVYLLIRRVITWHAPVSFIVTVLLFSWILGENPIYQILSGGLMLGAIFMATDYSTSPVTKNGQIIFGIGCGLLTVFIRYFGSYVEGVSYAILVMNVCVWLIDKVTLPRRFGITREDEKAAKAKAKAEAKGGAAK